MILEGQFMRGLGGDVPAEFSGQAEGWEKSGAWTRSGQILRQENSPAMLYGAVAARPEWHRVWLRNAHRFITNRRDD